MPLYTKFNLRHFIFQPGLRADEVESTVLKNIKTLSPNPKYSDFKKRIVFQVRFSKDSL